MKRSAPLVFAFVLFIAFALPGSAAAQSQDRDHPTQVKVSEIEGDLDASGNEYFYSFLAGPGELTITVDVKSSTGQALLNFELLDSKAAAAIICCEFAQADGDGQSARNVKTARLGNRQLVVLHVTVGKSGRGTYRVRLGGAIAFEKPAQG
ncbi:MAG TPA: hypothetical protein VNS63_23425 [Blastocatellia bacterium]|nr:hypothetical protein [Blastocatellia bacterium]